MGPCRKPRYDSARVQISPAFISSILRAASRAEPRRQPLPRYATESKPLFATRESASASSRSRPAAPRARPSARASHEAGSRRRAQRPPGQHEVGEAARHHQAPVVGLLVEDDDAHLGPLAVRRGEGAVAVAGDEEVAGLRRLSSSQSTTARLSGLLPERASDTTRKGPFGGRQVSGWVRMRPAGTAVTRHAERLLQARGDALPGVDRAARAGEDDGLRAVEARPRGRGRGRASARPSRAT